MKSNNASGGKKPINLGIEAEAMLQGKSFLKNGQFIQWENLNFNSYTDFGPKMYAF